jgi:predicted DNA-binding protein
MIFSVRLSDRERERLQQIAKESGRSKGSVVKRLLELTDIPEVQRLLGIREGVKSPDAAENR